MPLLALYNCGIFNCIPGSGVDCLQFLSQRTAGVGNLLTLQSAVLALFFYATTHVQDEQ